MRRTTLILLGLAIFGVLFVSMILVFIFVFSEDGMYHEMSTLPLPDSINVDSASYTSTGKIVFFDAPSDTEYTFSIVDDDGSNLKVLWSGTLHKQRSNGVRVMPYWDNKRVLIGDAVLECYPSLDNCQESKMVYIQYPPEIVNYPQTFLIWSEIVISQDSEIIGWTTLTYSGAIVLVGRLVRGEENYTIEDSRVISTLSYTIPDPENPGYILPQSMRGGEIKQFVRGGTGLTLAGSGSSGLSKSVFQDLLSEEVTELTREPGYEETMILSPDEKLGIVMSPRFSKNTSCAIFGLIPRPYSTLALANLISQVYQYSVTDVRAFRRKGNIGPVLVEVDKSIKDRNYHGIGLYDEAGEWMYVSPMSWHPNSLKAIWMETNKEGRRRVRMATVRGWIPGKSVPTKKTPLEEIPYSKDIKEVFPNLPELYTPGKIKGKVGEMEFSVTKNETNVVTTLKYNNFSEDGKVFFNGEESTTAAVSLLDTGVVYQGKVEMSGAETGDMDFTITFTKESKIDKSVSKGYARYGGTVLYVDDLLE